MFLSPQFFCKSQIHKVTASQVSEFLFSSKSQFRTVQSWLILFSDLQDAYNAMCDDLADKMHCLDVDQACHGLTNQSANIGFHKNATRIKEGIVMPDAWDGHSNYNTQRAIAEMRASTSLREAINNMIEQTSNDLEAQRLRTEYAFRKRIHEVLRLIYFCVKCAAHESL